MSKKVKNTKNVNLISKIDTKVDILKVIYIDDD